MRLKCNHVNVSQQLMAWHIRNTAVARDSSRHYFSSLQGIALGTTIKSPIHLEHKHSLAVRVPEHWHRLPTGCGVSSLEMSKSHLDVALRILVWVSLLEQRLGQVDSEALAASATL